MNQRNYHRVLAKELRRTNFDLGVGFKELSTSYQQEYPEHLMSCTSAVSRTVNKYPQGNISFGSTNKQGIQVSEAASRFRDFSHSVSVKSSKPDSNQYKKHQFTLGFVPVEYQTMANSAFFKKDTSQRASSEYKQNLQQSRSNNIQFGEFSTENSSIQKTEHCPMAADLTNYHTAKTIRKEQKKTHFIVGSTPTTYLTHNAACFAAKPLDPVKPFRAQSVNIHLGSSQPTYETTAKAAYSQLATASPSNVSCSASHDSRRTHFTLGTHLAVPQSTSHSQYQEFSISNSHKSSVGNTRKTSLHIGDSASEFTSSYNATYTSEEYNRPELISHKPTFSNITLGHQQQRNVSESASQFIQNNGKPAALDTDKERDLKNSHIEMGRNPTVYHTLYESYGSQSGPPTRLDPGRLSDMRSVHFTMGTLTNDYLTENSAQFFSKHSEVSRVQPYRGYTDISFGRSVPEYKTQYQREYTSPS